MQLDNVFITSVVSVQYCVLREKCFEAFYSLTNPHQQITAHVYDVRYHFLAVRSEEEYMDCGLLTAPRNGHPLALVFFVLPVFSDISKCHFFLRIIIIT
jgi:hypothetical protein